jgi:transcriptional regulator with XRE-family HTH domain
MARGTAPFNPKALSDVRRHRQVDGRRLSAAELARRVGTSKARILAYENGTSVPEPGRIEQLAEVFGIAPRQLCKVPADSEHGIRHLRISAGLTTAEAADLLGVSRTTYRELEQYAKLPARHDGTLPLRLAQAFSASPRQIHRALSSHPQAVKRREEITRLLTSLFERAHKPYTTVAISADEPELLALAALLRRPAGMTCRLVNHELVRLRGDLRDRELARATEAYAQSEEDMRRARTRVTALTERIDRAADVAAHSLPRFLAEAMSGRQWRLAVRLFTGEPVPDQRLIDVAEPEAWRGLITQGLIARERRSEAGAVGLTLSPEGLDRVLSEARLYACLYPRIPTPSRSARAQARQRLLLTRGTRKRWQSAATPQFS